MKKTDQNTTMSRQIEKAVIAFMLTYGLHYFAYFLRARYYTLLEKVNDPGLAHVLLYMGHLVILTVFLLYALAVRSDRRYILSFAKGKLSDNLKYGLFGGLFGFTLMGICIFAAFINGNISLSASQSLNPILFVFAFFAVLIQASTEEIEARGFLFGKMIDEGVSVKAAVLISSFFFAYLHAAKPGFGVLPLLTLFVVGIEYALSVHYFKTVWFCCGAHLMWNFTQDFIFGLPNSGTPSSISIFSAVANGSGFFYDQTFGIEGSAMSVIINILACILIILIGKKFRKDPKL